MDASLSEISTRKVLHVTQLILSTEEDVLPAQEDLWITPLIKFVAIIYCLEIELKPKRLKNKLSGGAEVSVEEHGMLVWVPRRLISDNGRQFQGNEITSWCQEMKITRSFTSVAYPQSNGQTEVKERTGWRSCLMFSGYTGLHHEHLLRKLLSIWYYTTSITQETPLNLVYGSEAVQPVEIGQSSARVEPYLDDNDQSRAMELDLVEEKRERAMIRMEAYRGWVMKSYNKRVWIRDFQIGDLVMQKFNPAGDVGKLEARWEGPFKIT
ncbi:uncharacterized protein LOC142554794 [Primulina tabacum]|uniref:uncharacterized protein LOC142554794 n=1 Tax=Primulina tabacum TaxID=48773 RepID=UPI003F592B65